MRFLARRRARPMLTHENIQAAVQDFKARGGLVHRLPEEVVLERKAARPLSGTGAGRVSREAMLRDEHFPRDF